MSSNIPTRRLGKNGPQVTALGFGAMGLSAFYGPMKPDAERLAILDSLYEMGERFWDSADVYGDSEDLLGKWFAANPEKRKDIFLCTKFANCVRENGERYVDSSPEYAKQACARSLKRLGVDHIDLYYCHRLDRKTPIEQTVRGMAELQAQGKVKYLGLSECSADSLRRACKISHMAAVQVEYSPFSLEIESDQVGVMKAARELGVAIVAYSPVGRGILSGTIRSPADLPPGDFRAMLPRFQPDNFAKNLDLVDRIVEMAKRKGCTPTQLCLAWLMAQGDDVIPIPGTTKVERARENLGAAEVTLTDKEEKEIRDACEAAEVHGTRYPEMMMQYSYADTPAE